MKSDAIIPASQAYTLFMLFDDVQIIVGYTHKFLHPKHTFSLCGKKYRVRWFDETTRMILVEEVQSNA